DWTGHRLATAGPDGSFRLEGLALGPTELEVRAPGFVREHHTVFADAYELSQWTIELERAAPITGRIVGAPADTKLEVYFWLQEPSEQRYIPTALDGSFVI